MKGVSMDLEKKKDIKLPEVKVEETMTWQILLPVSQTPNAKKLIEMAYKEGFLEAKTNLCPNTMEHRP